MKRLLIVVLFIALVGQGYHIQTQSKMIDDMEDALAEAYNSMDQAGEVMFLCWDALSDISDTAEVCMAQLKKYELEYVNLEADNGEKNNEEIQ